LGIDIIPGPPPALTPRIIGLVGSAGSGKDTVANMILDVLEGQKISLAGRFKEFAGEVFLFDENQLYGASHFRNAIDERYSYDPPTPGWPIDFDERYAGIKGKFTRFLDWLKPERIAPPVRLYTQEEIYRNRRSVWTRYGLRSTAFLLDVVPPGIPLEHARKQLLRVMNRILSDDQRNVTPRLVLQLLGSEFGRAVHVDMWADRTVRTANDIVASGRTAIITDVRFLNEAKKVCDAGGVLYYLENPHLEDATEKAGVAGHSSETELRSPEMRMLCAVHIVNDKEKGLDFLRGLVHKSLLDG
jgi:hypothetical protein